AHCGIGQVYYTKALWQLQQKQSSAESLETAQAELEQATKLNPEFDQAWRYLAEVELLSASQSRANRSGSLSRAESALLKMQQVNPNYADGWITEAKLQKAKGEVKRASDAIDKALSINPNSAEAKEVKKSL